MLIDLEELAGEIASKVDGAGLTPVIEKEIVHYEIIRSLGRNGLLQDITFQGGTSLRLCYGSQRYSEDLDFVAGDKFDSLPLDDFSRTLRCDLLRSYDTEVSVREPKVVNDFDNHCDALNAIVERCYGRVAASLGISDQVEHARRRLATEISSGSISAAGMPKRNLGLS